MTFIYIAEVYPTYDILADSTVSFDHEFYWNIVNHFYLRKYNLLRE